MVVGCWSPGFPIRITSYNVCYTKLLRHQLLVFEEQLCHGFDIVLVQLDAVDGTDGDTCRFVVNADTFRTAVGLDKVDRVTLFDSFRRTLFTACVACDTFVINQ